MTWRDATSVSEAGQAGKKACEEVEEVTGGEDGKLEGKSDIVVSRFGSISHSPFLQNFICYP
jgi:hypothetical protein